MTLRAVITGAFSYTGSAVARQLVERGWTVHTLTNRARPPGTEHITTAPFRFEESHLRKELADADAFINTYWIRLPWKGQTFETAVERSKMLFQVAKEVNVPRVVPVSVSNAADGRNLGYYRGKADVEEALRESGLSYGIVRPTLIVGPSDVLTNNIAWFLRHFPFFPIPGGGDYRLQPVTLEDTARIILGDITLTKEELLGLEQELLLSHESPRGGESVEEWLMANGESLGKDYINDIHRHFGKGSSVPVLNPGDSGQ
jgi:NADH dehydrogenase|tara:strand:- start:2026 stop:2802 length:777 start_codon:yes stop_codon:yes gene_type:complete